MIGITYSEYKRKRAQLDKYSKKLIESGYDNKQLQVLEVDLKECYEYYQKTFLELQEYKRYYHQLSKQIYTIYMEVKEKTL